MCLDLEEGKDVHSGVTAIFEGHSLGEFLVENNVTVITNNECRDMLQHNSTGRRSVKKRLNSALPYGLNDVFLCTQGIQDEEVKGNGS